ncbi:MAG: nitrilase-related carbon-nitrogen hydrolase [Nitrososphaerales archaeon]
MHKVNICVTQFKLKPYKRFDTFRDEVLKLINKSEGADFVVFGEWFTLGLLAIDTNLEKARYSDIKKVSNYMDDYVELFSKLARERAQFIVAGTIVEEDNDKYYDTCFMFDPQGKTYKHRKTHLFPLEREKWGISEHDSLNVIKTGNGCVGVCICYESQIPECARALALKGAEIIFCPSFTLTEGGYYRIRGACAARSIENQLITVMSSVIGNLSPMNLRGVGRSSILSPCDKPWPNNGLIAHSVMNKEMVVTAEIDIDDIYITREKGAARPHQDRIRRSALYKKWQAAGRESKEL